MDDDFAVSCESEADAEGPFKSDEVLVEVHLERGVTGHCENPKSVGSDIGAKKAVLVAVVVIRAEQGARRGTKGTRVGPA